MDCGVLKNGFYGDHAYTFQVGEVAEETQKLLEVTQKIVVYWNRGFLSRQSRGRLGHAIQSYSESFGYGVVRELVGHGLGKEMHEAPEIPNYGKRGRGKKFSTAWS